MKIAVFSGAPGAGKSITLVRQIASTPGKFILACPRIDLINERIRDLTSAAIAAGTEPLIVSVHSQSPSPLPVIQQVRDKFADVANTVHAVIAITHDTLLMLNPAEMAGWHVAIDEQVSGLSSNRHVIPTAVRILRESFEIVPAAWTGWGRLVPRSGAVTYGEMMRDSSLSKLADLVKWAGSPHGVHVDIARWDDIAGSNRPLGWISVWTYAALEHADSVTIAAANIENTLTYRATQALHPEVEFEHVDIPVNRPNLPAVIIHYFAKSHRGSSRFWAPGQPGSSCVVEVAKFLEGQDIGYWATNDNIKQHFMGRLSGIPVSIKVEGTNAFKTAESCAIIYSGKSRYEDEPLRKHFGWGKDLVERARECEDLLQFVQRGAIRCPDFSGEYHIYVYDEFQANWLARYFVENKIASVNLVAEHGPGIMDIERPKSGPRAKITKTAEQQLAERRARDRARKARQRRAKGIKPRAGRS